MPKVITITNEKGGVAKTTTTINLGVGLARHRKKVLLVDCNMQADLTSCFLGEDEIQSTLADAMIQTMGGLPIEKLDFIHPTEEGVDVIPAEKALIGVESQLVTALSREKMCIRDRGIPADRPGKRRHPYGGRKLYRLSPGPDRPRPGGPSAGDFNRQRPAVHPPGRMDQILRRLG